MPAGCRRSTITAEGPSPRRFVFIFPCWGEKKLERRHPAGIISENPTITTEVLAGRIGISTRAVEKHLANLKAQVLLSRIGPDQGGHWEVAGGVCGFGESIKKRAYLWKFQRYARNSIIGGSILSQQPFVMAETLP